jgi:hypothetical protein
MEVRAKTCFDNAEIFMFGLKGEGERALRFQIGSLMRGQKIRYLLYAFPDRGVAMLFIVLPRT